MRKFELYHGLAHPEDDTDVMEVPRHAEQGGLAAAVQGGRGRSWLSSMGDRSSWFAERPVPKSLAAAQLVASTPEWEHVRSMDWNFTLVFDDGTVNASVLPDGSMFVYSGLMRECGALDEASKQAEMQRVELKARKHGERRAREVAHEAEMEEQELRSRRLGKASVEERNDAKAVRAEEAAIAELRAQSARKQKAVVEEHVAAELRKARQRLSETSGYHGNDKLAIVLGHEIAHALLRHGGERLSENSIMQSASLVLSFGLWSLLPPDVFSSNFMMYQTEKLKTWLLELLIELPHSRQQESEADEVGLLLSAMACFDPRYAAQLWSDWGRSADDEGELEFTRTHPSSPHRAKDLAGPQLLNALQHRACSDCDEKLKELSSPDVFLDHELKEQIAALKAEAAAADAATEAGTRDDSAAATEQESVGQAKDQHQPELLLPSDSQLLPPGWEMYFDKNSQKEYFHNTKTGEVSWELPSAEA